MSEATDPAEDLRAAKLAARAVRRKQLKERGKRLSAEQAAEARTRMERAMREQGSTPSYRWNKRLAATKYY
jgi:hypothetical protein